MDTRPSVTTPSIRNRSPRASVPSSASPSRTTRTPVVLFVIAVSSRRFDDRTVGAGTPAAHSTKLVFRCDRPGRSLAHGHRRDAAREGQDRPSRRTGSRPPHAVEGVVGRHHRCHPALHGRVLVHARSRRPSSSPATTTRTCPSCRPSSSPWSTTRTTSTSSPTSRVRRPGSPRCMRPRTAIRRAARAGSRTSSTAATRR